MRTFYFHPTVLSKRKRNKTVARRATVAAVQDTNEDGKTILRYGLSVCSHKDRFVKQYGRATASGRALNPPSNADFVVQVLEEGEENKHLTKLFLDGAHQLLKERGFTVVPKPKKENATA